MGPGSEPKFFCTQEWLNGSVPRGHCPDQSSISGRHCQGPSLTSVGKVKRWCCREDDSYKEEEWRSGNSSLDDFYKRDASPCSNRAFCYSKTRDSQLYLCLVLFGKRDQDGPDIFHHEIHKRVKIFGYCGFETTRWHQWIHRSKLYWTLQSVNIYPLQWTFSS